MANLNIGFSAVATGTADVITATYSPAITLSDRRIVFLTGCVANTTTTTTFNPNSLGAQVIKGKGGETLKAGEILGDCILIYHTTGTYWELLASQLTRSTLAQILANGALTNGVSITGNNGQHALTLNDADAKISSIVGDLYGIVRTDQDLATITAGDDNSTSSTVTVSSVQAHVASDNLVNLDAPSVRLTQETASRVAILDASKDIVGADTATYPNLTEFSYVKGVTSSIQTQINAASSLLGSPMTVTSVQTLTGTTNETVMPIACPNLVGVLLSGHVLNLSLGLQATNNANAKTLRFYISDAQDALTNEVLIGSTVGTNAFVNTALVEKLMSMTSISTQNIISGTTSTTATGATIGTASIDFSSGTKYIVVTFQLATGTDTMKLQFAFSQINRKF